MKRQIPSGRALRKSLFVIVYSALIIFLNRSAQAQWDGASVQQLFYSYSDKSILGLYIDATDGLSLIYRQYEYDSLELAYRESLFIMSKEKIGAWTEPQAIGNPSYELMNYGKSVGFEPNTGLVHIFYEVPETLYYTNSSMPDWEVTKSDSGADRAQVEAMELDAFGNIHLAWYAAFDSGGYSWDKIMYANNSTGEWVKQGVATLYWKSGLRFAVEDNGTAHFLYDEVPGFTQYHIQNEGLGGQIWTVDSIPTPSVSFDWYGGYRILVDAGGNVHAFTGGCEDGECMTGYFDFYYFKEEGDSVWTGPDSTYQPNSDKLTFSWAYLDRDGGVHVALRRMGLMIPTHDYFYTHNGQETWIEPYQILYTEPYWPGEFKFVVDSDGEGHGAFVGYEIDVHWDTSGIYYLGPLNGTDVEDEPDESKRIGFHLFQNHPNPFNASTLIGFELREDCQVKLEIYDLLGQKIRVLENRVRRKGYHFVRWDGEDSRGREVASGVYFYQLRCGGCEETRKLILIR